MIKEGNIVTVRDNAWSRCITGETTTRIGRYKGDEINKFQVLVTRCKVQVEPDNSGTANTLIQHIDSGSVWAINDCNLSKVQTITVQFETDNSETIQQAKENNGVLRVWLRHGL